MSSSIHFKSSQVLCYMAMNPLIWVSTSIPVILLKSEADSILNPNGDQEGKAQEVLFFWKFYRIAVVFFFIQSH